MRLINTRTFTLETFASEYEVPRYAILSHTWEFEEVTFSDMQRNRFSHLHGFWKIRAACQQSRRDGINFLWVDTCCIDKQSSSELSETINSMFKWYRAAAVCYAYLQDVETAYIEIFQQSPSNLDFTFEQEAMIRHSQFARSRWWTRGWTLQELIAPEELVFYNGEFKPIGSKANIVRAVSLVSGIDEAILLHKADMRDVCVATKMSWAARRTTTRIEDIAYCLLGIFGINMAMLYGEGDRAFIRLQEEIIKSTNDQSIFAWSGYRYENGFLFAPRPSCFKSKYRIVPLRHWKNTGEFSLTNAGLDIQFPIWSSNAEPRKDRAGTPCERRCWIVPLACRYDMDFSGHIALELEETEEAGTLSLHPTSNRLFVFDTGDKRTHPRIKSLLIRREYSTSVDRYVESNFVLNMKCVIRWKGLEESLKNRNCYPPDSWSDHRDVMWVKRSANIVGALQLLTMNGLNLVLSLGYERDEEDTSTVSWGKEWIALESIKTDIALQEYCENYQTADSNPGKRSTEQELDFAGTICARAKIRRHEILEEQVFLVEISIDGIKEE